MKEMNLKYKSKFLLLTYILMMPSLADATEQNTDIKQQLKLLRQQNKLLMERIDKLEESYNEQSKAIAKLPDNPPEDKPPKSSGLSTIIKGTEVKIHGFVKADAIYDIGPKSGDRINYLGIPLDGTDAAENTGHMRFHARETRVNIQSTTPTDYGLLKFKVEADFFGGGTNSIPGSEVISNSYDFRLRQAFGSLGGVLLGQTWSTYVDVKSFPENLDFSNDTGQAFLRQSQIRYTHSFENNISVAVALENPETDFIDENGAVRLNQKDSMPDLTTRIIYKDIWGHVSVQGMLRELSVDDGVNSDSTLGYGIGTSGSINIFDKDRIRFHFSFGEGIGRYLQEAANSGAVVLNPGTSDVDIVSQFAYGGYLGYQHKWLPNLRSNFNAGYLKINWNKNLLAGVADTRNTEFKSFHTNLIWSITPKLDMGIEYAMATRKQENGESGDISRIQFSGKFKF